MILPLLLALQAADKLPPANPLPPPGTDEAAVMAPVTALLAGIGARDAQAIAATLAPDGAATIATEQPDGTSKITRMPWPALLARFTPGPERFDERLYAPAIEIDGDIAMIWGRYTFAIDGKLHHCGYDHFSMVRENGAWKIASIAWSKRTTGCETQ